MTFCSITLPAHPFEDATLVHQLFLFLVYRRRRTGGYTSGGRVFGYTRGVRAGIPVADWRVYQRRTGGYTRGGKVGILEEYGRVYQWQIGEYTRGGQVGILEEYGRVYQWRTGGYTRGGQAGILEADRWALGILVGYGRVYQWQIGGHYTRGGQVGIPEADRWVYQRSTGGFTSCGRKLGFTQQRRRSAF